MTTLSETFTSTGHKFFAHQEVMSKLRNGKGQPVVTHVMLTDVCNHKCAFCSVQARAGDSLAFDDVMTYLDTLIRYGLKAVILSGGGNPILYKNGGKDFNDVVSAIYQRGLEIGLITNGMLLRSFPAREVTPYAGASWPCEAGDCGRKAHWKWRGPSRDAMYCPIHVPSIKSWRTVLPETLDKLTWIRISMSGLDHAEREVHVPDINPTKTTLGFSYVAHDVYDCPEDPHHGKVSTEVDLLDLGVTEKRPAWTFESRELELRKELISYAKRYNPRYIRLLPNCLEPSLIQKRCDQLQIMASRINGSVAKEVAFVQNKPPQAPHACYLGYIHPVLNCDGWVYPCDSCVLNEAAGHSFANPWRVCRWDEVGRLYEQPVRSLIVDPAKTCPGCVFSNSNRLLELVVQGADTQAPAEVQEHVNFV